MPGMGQVLPGPAAADAGWMLGDDIRARVRVLVTLFARRARRVS
jgi:hypothetical protein